MRRLALLLGTLALLLGAARAQTVNTLPKFVAIGYCSSSSLGSAVPLTSFTGAICNGQSAQTLSQYDYIVFCAYVANVNWSDAEIPTASVGTGGQQLAAGACMPYEGTNPAAVQFIQQSAGAIVGARFYRVVK